MKKKCNHLYDIVSIIKMK